MIHLERLEELASRYVLGALDAETLAELEQLLSSSSEARIAFGEFCMDEVLLGDVLGESATGGHLSAPPIPPQPARHRVRVVLAAAALLLAFLAGWSVSAIVSPGKQLVGTAGTQTAMAPREPTVPLPIYYPVGAEVAARLVVYPLDFDESGELSTNPFVKFQPREITEL